MFIDTVSHSEEGVVALGRSIAYAVLAKGFAHPREELLALLTDRNMPADGRLGELIGRCRRAAETVGLEGLRSCYMRIFDPRRAPYPYEAEHRSENHNQRSELLVDLMGFYEAFAARCDHERPDHIACQLDFLHLLSVKEALALGAGKSLQVDICRRARAKFLSEHLLLWFSAVTEMVRSRAVEGEDDFYLAIAAMLEALMQEEAGALK